MSLHNATVHVSTHAAARWRERVGAAKVAKIVAAVRSSRVLRRGEPLPTYGPRLAGVTYAQAAGVVFVMRGLSASEFELITVLTS